MDIGVMGSGNVGRTLGGAWSRAGHTVRFGSREPSGEGTSGTHADVAGWAHVVVFAVPGAATAELARALGRALEGKTVIDASNRVGSVTLNSIGEIRPRPPARASTGPSRPWAGRSWPIRTSATSGPTSSTAVPRTTATR